MSLLAQEAAGAAAKSPVQEVQPAGSIVPQLMAFTGVAENRAGDTVEAAFRVYAEPEGGEPLWSETQQVRVGQDGRFSALLGAATQGGLPQALFSGGNARWVGLSFDRAGEQPRTRLASAPYAMKAADAESLAGHGAADFVTQEQLSAQLANTTQALGAAGGVHPDQAPTGSGAANTVALWTSASNLGASAITQLGTGSAPLVGVNTATPATTLDVAGNTTLRGSVAIPATAVATATTGVNSPQFSLTGSSFMSGGAAVNQRFGFETAVQGNNTASPSAVLEMLYASGTSGLAGTSLTFSPTGNIFTKGTLTLGSSTATTAAGGASSRLAMEASVFNSSTGKSVTQAFALAAQPANNNTALPSANLALLFGAGTVQAATGLTFSPTGAITFAPGQTFPGAGTITGVTATSPITGGGTSGSVSVGLDTAALEATLNGQYVQLGAPNTFTQNQTMNQGLTVGGTASANQVNSTTGYRLGGLPFETGNSSNQDVSLGFSFSPSETGSFNVGIGPFSLFAIAGGAGNTAVGANAMFSDVAGSDNTAVGDEALYSNQGGIGNVAVGLQALFQHPIGNFNTAIGYDALKFWPAGAGNTAVGDLAGLNSNGQPGGNQNTFIGHLTKAEGSAALTDAAAIGALAVVGESNAMILGGTGADAVTVGIGTSTPFNDYGLDVEAVNGGINSGVVVNANGGNLYLGMTNGVHKFRVGDDGEVHAAGYSTSGADFAESVAVRGQRSKYEPGDLLAIDPGGTRRLALARTPYSTLVAGIYSTKPGMLASPHDIDDPRPSTTEVPLAVIGIVPCKATAENGPIRVGDLLVASSRPGYAMKGTNRKRMLGAVVGKALEPLTKGAGAIQVLVTLQ